MGLDWGLVTKYTSYVVVEEREESVLGSLKNVDIDERYFNQNTTTNSFFVNSDLNESYSSFGNTRSSGFADITPAPMFGSSVSREPQRNISLERGISFGARSR